MKSQGVRSICLVIAVAGLMGAPRMLHEAVPPEVLSRLEQESGRQASP
jgi:hypothetical protein